MSISPARRAASRDAASGMCTILTVPTDGSMPVQWSRTDSRTTWSSAIHSATLYFPVPTAVVPNPSAPSSSKAFLLTMTMPLNPALPCSQAQVGSKPPGSMFCRTVRSSITSNPTFISGPISSAPLLTESGANAELYDQATSSAVRSPQSPPLLCQATSARILNVMLLKSDATSQDSASPRSAGE